MCGIVGYIGEKVEKTLVEKLKKLEYRGYDSAGIAVSSPTGLTLFKSKGEIVNLEKKIKAVPLAKSGIGHTRWATHGKPDETNAHPHTSEDKKWAIVHNGIIENYSELKERLKKSGATFYSETDSEVVPKLLQYHYEKDAFSALKKTVAELKGSYALAVLREGDDALYFAKNKSPLFIAVNGKSALASSDVICFNGFASVCCVINDGEVGCVKDGKLTVENKFGKVTPTLVKCDAREENKAHEFRHYMLKEIYDTENVLKNIYGYYSERNNLRELADIDVKNYERAIFTGCGTAYHACLLGAKFLSETAGLDCFAVVASELRYENRKINDKTLVVLVSQSGETADTLAALLEAKEKGAKTVALVNVEYSALAKRADVCLPVKAGIEVAVASTKAFSAQVATLNILSNLLASNAGNERPPTDGIKKFLKNFNFGQIQLYRRLSDVLKYQSKIFMIGRGADYYVALEASLKIKETCYINSDTYYAGELKHGFLALIDETTYVVVFATERKVLSKTLANAEEAYSRGAKLILFTCFDDIDRNFKQKCEFTITVRETGDALQAIENIIPWQLTAYYTSIGKGINPDRPRNLAKSVTVE